jgi:hypothetical protein
MYKFSITIQSYQLGNKPKILLGKLLNKQQTSNNFQKQRTKP